MILDILQISWHRKTYEEQDEVGISSGPFCLHFEELLYLFSFQMAFPRTLKRTNCSVTDRGIPRSMTSRKFCYLVVTKDVFPQKQRLPNPSVKVEKIHCICLMTAIPYTCVPQLCKEVSKVCIMKVLEIMKFQEYLSRQVQGIYAGLTISLEWLKLQPTDIKH